MYNQDIIGSLLCLDCILNNQKFFNNRDFDCNIRQDYLYNFVYLMKIKEIPFEIGTIYSELGEITPKVLK